MRVKPINPLGKRKADHLIERLLQIQAVPQGIFRRSAPPHGFSHGIVQVDDRLHKSHATKILLQKQTKETKARDDSFFVLLVSFCSLETVPAYPP